MAVKFLSEDWAQQVTENLNANEEFRKAAGGQNARLQQVVNTPDGETRYYFRLEDGTAEVSLGELPDAEATISQDYETAVALSKGELSPTAAYMSGKVKVSGDLMRLMQMQGIFGALPSVLAQIDVEY